MFNSYKFCKRICIRSVVNKCYATCMTRSTEMCPREVLSAGVWAASRVVVVGSNFGK